MGQLMVIVGRFMGSAEWEGMGTGDWGFMGTADWVVMGIAEWRHGEP